MNIYHGTTILVLTAMARPSPSEIDLILTDQRVPNELKRAVAAVDSDLRWKIVELLLSHKELSYTELVKKLGIRKGSLTYHLNQLKKGAILENYAKEDFKTLYDSYYSVSPYGRQFIDSLFSSLSPLPPTNAALVHGKTLSRFVVGELKEDVVQFMGKHYFAGLRNILEKEQPPVMSRIFTQHWTKVSRSKEEITAS